MSSRRGQRLTESADRVRVAEVTRTSRARLLAILSASTHDIAAAEDALADAIEAALTAWPAGMPDNPEAWLLTVARHRLRDRFRSAAVRKSVGFDEAAAAAVPVAEMPQPHAIEDKRLELMFVCAHPAIDPTVRTPLMLQVVLGLDAKQIAAAFAIPATTMAQRLVRAKRRIREARIPFTIPEHDALPARLDAVLEAVYGAYAIDWRGIAGVTQRDSLSGEALYLARTLTELLPDDAEVLGLNALIALSAARGRARVCEGMLVPVDEQDPALWDESLIEEGETLLDRAHRLGRTGRFQLEAAAQSVHCHRRISGAIDWGALERLYRALFDVAPTLGAAVSLAAVIGETSGPVAGLRFLDSIDATNVARFQPAWATRAHLLARAGERDAACQAYDRAIALATDPTLRRFLQARRATLQTP